MTAGVCAGLQLRPAREARKGADGVDDRMEERFGEAEARFERAAESFRHAGGLFERAAKRFVRPAGRSERANKAGHADVRSERTDEAGHADGYSAQPENRFAPSDGQSGRTAIHERELRMDLLAREMERLSTRLERSKISEYVDLLNRPLSLIWRNFVGGMARGIGIAIGFTFFAATILYVLQMLGKLNLPIIGDYIADIVRIVQRQLEGRTY